MIAAAVLTLIAVGVAKETRDRDLYRVEEDAPAGETSAATRTADARTA